MTSNNVQKPPQRLLHLDLLRIVAIYLVIFNHTGDRGYLLFTNRMDSPLYFLYMMVSVFCKIAVPIFFMISGALLLPRQETFRKLFSKRILRMAVVLMIMSIPYYFWLHRSNGIGVSNFLTYIYGNSATTALWYLYSYIALLLSLPFLRSMVKNLQQKDFIYLIMGHIILVGVVPCLEQFLWQGSVTLHESFSPVLFMSQNIFYALTGYFLEHILDEKYYNAKTIWLCTAASVCAVAITCFVTHSQIMVHEMQDAAKSETFFNCFISVPSITVYILLKHTARRIKRQGIQKWLTIIGGAVFGVYLIEKFVRSLTKYVFLLSEPVIGSFAASFIWIFAVLIVSLLIVIPLKHIPGIKKIVNKFI